MRIIGLILVLAVLLPASVGMSGCGSPTATLPPDPPQISLTLPASAIADTRIQGTATLSGCDSVAKLALYDGERYLRDVAFSGNPAAFEVLPTDVDYQNGIAALVTLQAQVFCADGRSNKSQPVTARFLPVTSRIAGTNGGQAAPEIFFASGTGADVRLAGCTQFPDLTTGLVEVDTFGNITRQRIDLPFPCTTASQFTDLSATGYRWLWEPGVAAVSFTQDLAPRAVVSTFKPKRLILGPDGDAVAMDEPTPGLGVARFARDTGALVWSQNPGGDFIGDPVVKTDGRMLLPLYRNQLGDGYGILRIEARDYRNGELLDFYDLFTLPYTGIEDPIIPPAALSTDGSTAYFGVEAAANISYVVACVAESPNACNGTTQRWRSDTLKTKVVMIYPFAQNSRLAVIGPQMTYFLDAATGKVLNSAKPIMTTGALLTRFVQSGHGKDIYILNGPAKGLPREVIAVDSAEAGELYRFEAPAGTLMMGVDDDGQSWLRINKDLVKPYPLTEYRRVRP